MTMGSLKYYVVWVGKKPGIYDNWTDCQRQVQGVKGARFRSFPSRNEAERAYREGWKKHWGQSAAAQKSRPVTSKDVKMKEEIDYNSISVDVGTRGNPGPVEYKGVDTRTGEVLFSHGPIAKGTNNIGEFLAIVHGLAYLKQRGSNKTVYSDSVNAIKWVRQKKVATTLPRDETTEEIWRLIDRAERWLQNNDYDNEVRKWQTDQWGEIKADYGRK